VLNHLLYGSALASGYGDPGHLFSLANVPRNLARYPRWLVETQTPWVMIGLLGPLLLSAPRADANRADRLPDGAGVGAADGAGATAGLTGRRLARALLAVVGVLLAIYLPYVPFDEWSYLRFLLPVVILLVALSSAVTVRLPAGLPAVPRVALLLGLTAGLAALSVGQVRERSVFGLRDSEARFVETAEWIRDHLPSDAVLLTVWHSGSVRYHGGRPSVLWDAVAPAQLDLVVDSLQRQGRTPFVVVESWEEAGFRKRFISASQLGALDWPPRAQVGRQVRVYDPAARGRFFRGQSVASERVWTASERRAFGRR
jgi:hypothetical protein